LTDRFFDQLQQEPELLDSPEKRLLERFRLRAVLEVLQEDPRLPTPAVRGEVGRAESLLDFPDNRREAVGTLGERP
jgi:hypothetical protein